MMAWPMSLGQHYPNFKGNMGDQQMIGKDHKYNLAWIQELEHLGRGLYFWKKSEFPLPKESSLNTLHKQHRNLSWVNLSNISWCFIVPLMGKASENMHTNSITTARSHRTNGCRNELSNFEVHRNNERDKQITTRTRIACFVYSISAAHTGKHLRK